MATSATVVSSLSNEKVIAAIFKRRYLWDRQHEMYRSRDFVEKGWSAIALEVGLPKHATKAKWKGLRDTFRRELVRKMRKYPDGETAADFNSSWQHFKSMFFLKDQLTYRKNIFMPEEYVDVKTDENLMIEHGQLDQHERTNDFLDDLEEKSLPQDPYLEHASSSPCRVDDVKRRVAEDFRKRGKDCNRDDGPLKDDEDVDSDLHFFKSLIPYTRNLQPVDKLVLRTQIQNLVLQYVRQAESDHKDIGLV